MPRNIFDSHAHYDDERFDPDREALLASLPGAGVSFVISCGSDLANSAKAVELASRYDYIYAAAGVHPQECGDGVDLDELRRLLSLPKIVALGEIGLDYYYPEPARQAQKFWFARQLEAAHDTGLPVLIHNRDAHADTLEILKKHRPPGVMHCFSGSVEYAREILSLGMHIGLGGTVTFKNARHPKEVAAMVPLERLLLETDAPYLAPEPLRGSRCDSSMIAHTARAIADIRGMDVQE